MSKIIGFRIGAIASITIAAALSVSACGGSATTRTAQENTLAANQPVPIEQNAQLIKRLEAAKQLDQSNSFDPDLTPIRREDFMVKAAKADRAIRELSKGFSVSSREIEDALEIPPRHLTPEKRAQLIEQLTQAKRLDEQREQEILIYYRADQPNEREQFESQAQRAADVAKALQLGESVHWDDIKDALYVPSDPL